MKKLLALTLFAASLPILQGCAPALVTGAAVGTLAAIDRRSIGTQTEDEGIEWKITARVSEKFGERVHVNQTSFNRRVLLTGEVPDAAAKAEVERIAAGVPNVKGVWNELLVAPNSAYSSRSNDAYITSKVKARFIDSNRFRANLAKVVTESGVVYLMGIVTQAEADAAVSIARTTAGVRKVVNVMEIITAQQARELDPPPPDRSTQPRQQPGA